MERVRSIIDFNEVVWHLNRLQRDKLLVSILVMCFVANMSCACLLMDLIQDKTMLCDHVKCADLYIS